MKNNQVEQWERDILPLFPEKVRNILLNAANKQALEEIRLRANQPIQLCYSGYDSLVYAHDDVNVLSVKDCMDIINRMAEYSVYAWEDELKKGFITIRGGYRVGLCGKAVLENSSVQRITDFTSINIRIARERVGCANDVMKKLYKLNGELCSTLIISPPGCGKTTMLRDIARGISYGIWGEGQKVCIIDERMELTGCVRGVPQFDVGPRTDVLSGCSKPEGVQIAIRTLSPRVIITDELGSYEDVKAIMDAAFSGVTAIASAHASNINSIMRRRPLMQLVHGGIFNNIVQLGRHNGSVGIVKEIYSGDLKPIAESGKEILCIKFS